MVSPDRLRGSAREIGRRSRGRLNRPSTGGWESFEFKGSARGLVDQGEYPATNMAANSRVAAGIIDNGRTRLFY